MNNVICYHHNDLDGRCSAAIVKKFFDKFKTNVKFIECAYNKETDFKQAKNYDKVIMVDFGIQPFDGMKELNKTTNFIWIDHHKSAIDNMKKSKMSFNGIQREGDAGCELTWEYFFNSEIPEGVKLIGTYDVWRNEDKKYFEERSNPYFVGIESYLDNSPTAEVFNDVLTLDNKKFILDTIEKGKSIIQYRTKQFKDVCNSSAFDVEWEGYNWAVLNTSLPGSYQLESYFDSKKHDAMMVYKYDGEKWCFGLYDPKKKNDLSKIAKKHGGGGHPGAAGFTLNELPF